MILKLTESRGGIQEKFPVGVVEKAVYDAAFLLSFSAGKDSLCFLKEGTYSECCLLTPFFNS